MRLVRQGNEVIPKILPESNPLIQLPIVPTSFEAMRVASLSWIEKHGSDARFWHDDVGGNK